MEVTLLSHKLRLVSRHLPLTFAIMAININYSWASTLPTTRFIRLSYF